MLALLDAPSAPAPRATTLARSSPPGAGGRAGEAAKSPRDNAATSPREAARPGHKPAAGDARRAE
jgi:hypothetical protein